VSTSSRSTSNRIERFEDLVAWQKARVLTGEIYRTTRSDSFYLDASLKSQLRRASVSIMANIAEGFERSRPSEFHQFLSVAKASCAEVRSHLYVALDAGFVTRDEFNNLKALTEEVGRVVGGLRAAVERRRQA
jgi:four helix bundle protein